MKKNVDIDIRMQANTAGAKQTVEAMKQIDKSVQSANTGAQAMTANTSKLGSKAGQVGFQLQDIAVQAQAGTNAVTILAQQGSQIAGVFGPTGAIAGAIIALGAVAGKFFYDMAVASATTGEAMEDMSDKLKEAFGEQAKQMVKSFNAEIANQTALAGILRNAEDDLTEARLNRESADSKLIGTQAALQTAAVKYLDATGQIINAEKALTAIRDEAEQKTKDAAIKEVENRVEMARQRYNSFTKQTDDIKAEADAATKRLAELEARQQEVSANLSYNKGQDSKAVKYGLRDEGYVSVTTQAAQGEADQIKTQIENLMRVQRESNEKMQSLFAASMEQAAALDVTITNAKTEIATINEQYNLTESAQVLTDTTAALKSGAEEISKGIEGIEPVNELQRVAKDTIKQAVADGEITAQEQVAISQNLQILMSSLQTGQATQLGSLQELIKINNDFAAQMNAANQEIRALKVRVGNLQGVR